MDARAWLDELAQARLVVAGDLLHDDDSREFDYATGAEQARQKHDPLLGGWCHVP